MPRRAAGGEEQLVVWDDLAVIEPNRTRRPVDLHRAPTEMGLNPVLREERLRPDEQLVALEAAGQKLLGERRTLVGQPRFLAHQRELVRETLAPQCVDRLDCR